MFSQPTLVVGRSRLRHRLIRNTWHGRQVRTQLAALTLMHAAVVAPEVGVASSVGFRVELEDGDAGLLAIASHEAQVLDRGLGGTVGAFVDAPAGPLLLRRVGIELHIAVDAFPEHHVTSLG